MPSFLSSSLLILLKKKTVFPQIDEDHVMDNDKMEDQHAKRSKKGGHNVRPSITNPESNFLSSLPESTREREHRQVHRH